MRHMTVEKTVIEVFGTSGDQDGLILGYVIENGGTYDGWWFNHVSGRATRVASDETKEEAIKRVSRGY